MSNKLFASILAAALSLASAASFAAPVDHEARDQASPAKAQVEERKTRYWSHPRLGMVKVDAAGRMLTARSTTDNAARRPAAPSEHPSTRTR